MQTSANVLFNRTCRVHQVNPALTLALLATRRLDVLRALVYIAAQCLGACLGAGALYLALPLKTTAEHFVNKVSGSRDLPAGSGSSAPLPPPPLPSPGPDAAERGSGSGRRGLVHLPDGLHRFLRGGAAAEGEPRTRKSGHWTRPLGWSSAGGEKSSWDVFDGVQNQTCPISFRPGSPAEA